MFVVKSLTLRRRNYYSQSIAQLGPLEGEMELQSEKSKLELQLTPEQTQRIMAIIAEAVVDTAKEASSIMTNQVAAQVAGVEVLGA